MAKLLACCLGSSIFMVFQVRISTRNIDLIITKLENDLGIGYHHTTFKFHEDIPQFRMKTRSVKFASQSGSLGMYKDRMVIQYTIFGMYK